MWPAYCSGSWCDSCQALWGCAGVLLKRHTLVWGEFWLQSHQSAKLSRESNWGKKKKKKIIRKCYVTVAVAASLVRKLFLGKLHFPFLWNIWLVIFPAAHSSEPSQKQEQESSCRISFFFKMCFEKTVSMIKLSPWSHSLCLWLHRLQSEILLMFYLNAAFLLS